MGAAKMNKDKDDHGESVDAFTGEKLDPLLKTMSKGKAKDTSGIMAEMVNDGKQNKINSFLG